MPRDLSLILDILEFHKAGTESEFPCGWRNWGLTGPTGLGGPETRLALTAVLGEKLCVGSAISY